MKTRNHYNVLAVYSLRDFAGRDSFYGVLGAMSNTQDWHLSTVRPGRFFSERELLNEENEAYDGFILSMPGTDGVMAKIAASNTPTVLVNITDRRLSARCERIASVWTDNADIGRLAARHLLENGRYKSAGYVHEREYRFYSCERMAAFRKAMKRGGCATSVFPENDNFNNFFSRLRTWVKKLPKPAAVMAVSDMRAADVINACTAEGLSVPDQVSVIGVDHDVSQHVKCGMSISSVVCNQRQIGVTAVRELDFLFRHPNWKGRPHEILVPAKNVFCGKSTARSNPSSRLVTKAFKFIEANKMRNLTRRDVAAHLGCSVQLAELRFKQLRGQTVSAAITNIRMNEARYRIRHERNSVRATAEAMDFTSPNHLSRIYKRHFGRTISEDLARDPEPGTA